MQIVVFELKDKYYAFKTSEIEEITKPLPTTTIPQSPAWVKGLVNLRGQIMSLLDFNVLLNGVRTSKELWYNNTIIVNTEDNPIALMTGNVVGVKNIDPKEVQLFDEDDNSLVYGYIFAYNEMVSIIQIESILKEKEEVV